MHYKWISLEKKRAINEKYFFHHSDKKRHIRMQIKEKRKILIKRDKNA